LTLCFIVGTRAGQGVDKPTRIQIEEIADRWAFPAKNLVVGD